MAVFYSQNRPNTNKNKTHKVSTPKVPSQRRSTPLEPNFQFISTEARWTWDHQRKKPPPSQQPTKGMNPTPLSKNTDRTGRSECSYAGVHPTCLTIQRSYPLTWKYTDPPEVKWTPTPSPPSVTGRCSPLDHDVDSAAACNAPPPPSTGRGSPHDIVVTSAPSCSGPSFPAYRLYHLLLPPHHSHPASFR